MISIIRQLDFSFLCQFHMGLEKTVLIPLNSTFSQNLQHSFSHGLIEFNSDPIKDYSDHILREFSLYNRIVLDYFWDLLNSVIGKNCNLFRNISKSFSRAFILYHLVIKRRITQTIQICKISFRNLFPFSIFDRYSFTFSILYSAVYFFPSILVPHLHPGIR